MIEATEKLNVLEDGEFVKVVNKNVTDGKHPLALFKGAIISGFPEVQEDEETMIDNETETLLNNVGLTIENVLCSVTKDSLIEVLKHV